jgi:UDP-glucose 4-epimerase
MGLPQAVGRVFNIGSDRPVSILELAGRVIAAVDPSLRIEFVGYAEAYSQDFEDCRRRVPDLGRLREALGFEPRYDLDGCIREVIAWKRGQTVQRPGR